MLWGLLPDFSAWKLSEGQSIDFHSLLIDPFRIPYLLPYLQGVFLWQIY